jgi:hypothetical protein
VKWDRDGPCPKENNVAFKALVAYQALCTPWAVGHWPKDAILSRMYMQPCSLSPSPTLLLSYSKMPAGISATTYIFDKPQLAYLETLVELFEEQHQKWDPKFISKSAELSKWIQQTAEETMRLPLFKDLPRDEPKYGLKEWIGVSHKTISIYDLLIY